MSNHHHHHNGHNHHDNHKGHSHSHETFKQVEIDGEVQGHFDLVAPLVKDYFQGKFNHVKLEHVYAQKCGKHDWFYWAQCQIGEFGDKHNWTIVFEIKDHHAILDSVHEGHKTFFWWFKSQYITILLKYDIQTWKTHETSPVNFLNYPKIWWFYFFKAVLKLWLICYWASIL